VAVYETSEEVREIIIDQFDRQTGRGDFLRKTLLLGAGMAAGATALSSGLTAALASTLSSGQTHLGVPQGDIDVLNYALTLEHIEATFYRTTKRPPPTSALNRQIAQYVDIIAADEKAHVDALTAAITSFGGIPVKEATYTFPPLSLPFGITVENLGVHAYLGAASLIQTPAILLTAASIVTVEARHAAAWMTLYWTPDNRQSPVLGPFDASLSKYVVVKAVTPFFTK